MMNTTTTPPVLRTLFPIKGNEKKLKAFEQNGYRFEIAHGYACYEGSSRENALMRYSFVGAVTA